MADDPKQALPDLIRTVICLRCVKSTYRRPSGGETSRERFSACVENHCDHLHPVLQELRLRRQRVASLFVRIHPPLSAAPPPCFFFCLLLPGVEIQTSFLRRRARRKHAASRSCRSLTYCSGSSASRVHQIKHITGVSDRQRLAGRSHPCSTRHVRLLPNCSLRLSTEQ